MPHPYGLLCRSVLCAPVLLSACNIPEIVEIEGPDVSYVQVTTGDLHACGLTADGEVYCWRVVDPRPRLVSGAVRFRLVDTHTDHTCGISIDGLAYCWGLNNLGQLGTASEDECPDTYSLGTVACSHSPILVDSSRAFQSIGVGAAHTCALGEDGAVFCWGLNHRGQLGAVSDTACGIESVSGGVSCSQIPLPVAGDHRFVSLSVGDWHNCAVATDGTAFCWGAGGLGRLGNGSLDDTALPVPVEGGIGFRSLSAGGTHTCGVAAEGTLYCWGSNAALQLGSKAKESACGDQLSPCVTQPHQIASALRFQSVTASQTMMRAAAAVLAGHTCGIASDGNVYCWGLNESGQVAGSNDFTSSFPVRLDVDVHFVEIDAGMANTCGVTTDDAIYCWSFGTPWSAWREVKGTT